MNKYELATELAKLANELFKKETKLLNIEEGFIENINNVVLDKAARFALDEEFNEVNTSELISQFIRFKAIPEMETWIIDDMLKFDSTESFLGRERTTDEIILYSTHKEFFDNYRIFGEDYAKQLSKYALFPENRFPEYVRNFTFINDIKYIFKIYIKYLPPETNNANREELALRILVERKVG